MSTESVSSWADAALPIIGSVAIGIAILVVGWMVAKWVHRLVHGAAERAKLDPALSRFFASIARYTVIAAAVIAALGRVGVQTASLLTIFASAGLAVGLALQGSLANFAAGVMILFFRPFDLGHRITAASHFGDVQDIGLFATTLLTLQNELIIIPNSAVMNGSIVNYTAKGTLRASIEVGIGYGESVEAAMAAMLEGARAADLVLDDPAPDVAFVGLGASSVDFLVHVWSKSTDYIPMQHNARTAIYAALNAANIEIPFQQIVIHTQKA